MGTKNASRQGQKFFVAAPELREWPDGASRHTSKRDRGKRREDERAKE